MGTTRIPRQRAAALTAIAARQHGLFTAAQARSAGFSKDAIRHRVRTGTWRSVDYGVYSAEGTPGSWYQRLLAACLGGPAVASHRSAAALWSLPGFGRSTVEVTAIRHRRRYPGDVVWHESVLLENRAITEIDAIPCTDVTRTLIDLGSVCESGMLVPALDDALRRGLTSVDAVARRLEFMGTRRRGSARVREAVSRRSNSLPVPESVLESRFEVLIVAAGLPQPERQHEIFGRDGVRVARVDFAYPAARLAIEVDGLRFHAGADDWRRDLARQNRIVALGWLVLRFTAADLELRPREVASAIERALVAEMRS
jgi:hypothetical protein